MRVLFLNPPFHPRFSREQRSPAVTKSGTLYYPKWLATAAGVAIKNGHDVDLVDSPAAGYTVQTVIDRINAKDIQAVVCDTSTPSILNDVGVVESLVAARPSLHILMVGRHVSSLPKETRRLSKGKPAASACWINRGVAMMEPRAIFPKRLPEAAKNSRRFTSILLREQP